MPTNFLSAIASLTDRDLLTGLQSSLADERKATAHLVAHLGEIGARKLYAAEGYDSMFTFCVEALHMAEHAAYNRIAAARAARSFPVILDMLAGGELHVTAVRLLAPHLTADNHRDLLAKARHKSRREVERILAALAPQPPVPTVMRRLPVKTIEGAAPPAPISVAPPQVSAPPRPPVVAPLSPQTFKLQCTLSTKTHEKLRLAQDMLRHQLPGGDVAQVLDRALTALLEDLARQKFAATDKPRPSKPAAPGSRHIPSAVKRPVWLRDLGRCTFVAENGKRCSATGMLEFHHVKPFAAGGEATVSNLRLACRAHNAFEAQLVFGPAPRPDSSRDESASTRGSRSPGTPALFAHP